MRLELRKKKFANPDCLGHIYCPLVRVSGYQQDRMSAIYSSPQLDQCQSTPATDALTKVIVLDGNSEP